MNIFISGSMAYDRIMDFPGKFSDHILADKIHVLNVCFTVNGMVEKFGGTAGNIAYTLSLLGENPLILATIGKDYETYFRRLRALGISTDGIRIVEEEFTAGAYITTDMSDNQITGFNPGAMKHQAGYDIGKVEKNNAIGLLAPGNLQDMIDYAEFYKAEGIKYICDPGQSLTAWDGSKLRDWIDGSFMLITNDYELELVMKMTGLDKNGLLKLTECIITTLGDQGAAINTLTAAINTLTSENRIPAVHAEPVVDPTGAGDAFRAGLLKGLASKCSLEEAAKMGAVAGAYAVEKYGTQEHSFTVEEFMKRYQKG